MENFNKEDEMKRYLVVAKQMFFDEESMQYFAEKMVQSAYIEYLKITFMDKIMPNAKKNENLYSLVMLQINYAFDNLPNDLLIIVEDFIENKNISNIEIKGYSLSYIIDRLAENNKSNPRFYDFLFLRALPIMKRYINSQNKSLDSILSEFYFDLEYEYEFLWRNLLLFTRNENKRKVQIYSKLGVISLFKGELIKYIDSHNILKDVRFCYQCELRDAIYNMPKELALNFIQFINNESISNIVINDVSIPQIMKKYGNDMGEENDEFCKTRYLVRDDMKNLNYKERFIHSAYEMIKKTDYFTFNFDECYQKYLSQNNDKYVAQKLAMDEYRLSIIISGTFKLTCNTYPYNIDFQKENFMKEMLDGLPDRLLTNVVEWINGKVISDIYYCGCSISSIMNHPKYKNYGLDFDISVKIMKRYLNTIHLYEPDRFKCESNAIDYVLGIKKE